MLSALWALPWLNENTVAALSWGEGEHIDMRLAPRAHTPKGGIKMTGFAEVIVWMWFLPVALYIVLPLFMLCCWLIGRLAVSKKVFREAAVTEPAAITPEMLAKAGI